MAPAECGGRRSSVLSVLRRSKESKDDAKRESVPLHLTISAPASIPAADPDLSTRAPRKQSEPIPRKGFFDLPAELRNEIYHFVICDAVLTLPAASQGTSWRSRTGIKKANKLAPMPINGLLLASKQSRHEYMTVLLSTMQVDVDIKDFDFDSLMRVSSRLSEVEVGMLKANKDLVISLSTQNCTAKALGALRRWLEFRAHEVDGLPWRYRFPLERKLPPHAIGRIRLLRELELYHVSISHMSSSIYDVREGQELQHIIEAFEHDIHWLEQEVGWLGRRTVDAAMNARGLAGGGLR